IIYPLENLFTCIGKVHRRSTTRPSARRGTSCSFASTSIFQLLSTTAIFVDAHGDITKHAIVDAHATLELGNLAARSFDREQNKRAVPVVQDFVSKLALAHRLG